ncbi:MAG: hypothetical protein IPM45_16930 [Acidimicrobiales bacterium]|nr:hypothetical protein [Acidimicrobiales bacterium]
MTPPVVARAGAWPVERAAGSAAAFHDRPLPDPPARAVWVLDVDGPALVLGSGQDPAVVDADAARRGGVTVVRRRSGGGAVLLEPGEALWVDVVVPPGDPCWDDDVGRAFHWLGDAWAAALAGLGVAATVHRGPLVRTGWSSTVCFAGLGSGEVTVDGRKLVGMSQRRTRRGARFQCVVPRRWRPERLLALLVGPGPAGRPAEGLRAAAVGLDDLQGSPTLAALREAVLVELAKR